MPSEKEKDIYVRRTTLTQVHNPDSCMARAPIAVSFCWATWFLLVARGANLAGRSANGSEHEDTLSSEEKFAEFLKDLVS